MHGSSPRLGGVLPRGRANGVVLYAGGVLSLLCCYTVAIRITCDKKPGY